VTDKTWQVPHVRMYMQE